MLSEMNSYERVMTAMRLEQPDRVPIIESVIDTKIQRAICLQAKDSGDLSDYLDLDNVGCGCHFARVESTDDGWIDEWGVRYIGNAEIVAHPVSGPIKSLTDLRNYHPPDPDAPHRLGLLPELVKRYKGKRAITFHHRAAFMWSAYLMGMEEMLLAFAIDQELLDAVLEMVTQVNRKIAINAARAGADIVTLGDDYAANIGPMFSPDHFKQFIQPRLKSVIDAIHEAGALVIKHSDGYLWPLLEPICQAGADAINPIEPTARMDIGEVKSKFGDRMCLVGNIDCGELLSHGSVEEVRQSVQQCIEAASAGGGFILSSSNSIHSSVNPDNYQAMIHAGREFGSYE